MNTIHAGLTKKRKILWVLRKAWNFQLPISPNANAIADTMEKAAIVTNALAYTSGSQPGVRLPLGVHEKDTGVT